MNAAIVHLRPPLNGVDTRNHGFSEHRFREIANHESFDGVHEKTSFSIIYFPLELFFSSTVFKVQGQPLESACALLEEN
jgi:hypothetical protein